MRVLAMPYGTPAVRWYRYQNALRHMPDVVSWCKYDVRDDQEWELEFATWLDKNGLDWDVVWTGDYNDPAQAFLDIFADRGAKIVSDIDDWFCEVPGGNMASAYWKTPARRENYEALLARSARVSASTPILAEKYGGTVSPNFVVPEDWGWPQRPPDDGLPTVLCAAGTGRAGDFMAVADQLEAAVDHCRFVFMGAFPEWALKYPAGKVIWCRWVPNSDYPRMLRWLRPDIMISPMQRHVFNQAKSNLKWLEASMAGAVFVGENWGEYARTVEDGETGVLIDGDWTERLVWLCKDTEARKRISLAARDEVVRNWTWDAVGPAWRAAVLGDDRNGYNYAYRAPDAPIGGLRAAAS